jgi:CheY-like chemotaxis protein
LHSPAAAAVGAAEEDDMAGASRGELPAAVPHRRLHVLVADDNRVNQQLATRIIEKAGHLVMVAADGLEALQAVQAQAFDLVVMDVQMPVMDGLAATAAIRRHEAETGDGHLPIVALTAHAMVGDRDECLAAGMDDYLTKPVKGPELLAVLDRIAGTTTTDVSAFDATAALDYTGGDLDLLRDLLDVFREDAPAQLEAVRAAVASRDAAALRQAAHCLKGSLRAVGATVPAGLAQELEHRGGEGTPAGAEELTASLVTEIDRLLTAMADWLSAPACPADVAG